MKFKKQKLLTVVVFLFLLTTLALAACGAKAHVFSDGEWEVTKEATCTESGSKRRVCTVEGCGHTEVVTVPALGHDLIPEQITERPLCETGGTMTMKCSRCDFKDEITLQPFNHVYPQAPDCAEGVKCMVCGKERIPLKQHAYKTEAGHEHECADCGYAYTSDLVFTAINDGKEWRVSEPDGNAFWSVKELVVPAYKEGKPVTELAEGSFNNDYSLQAVRLPYTLKKLNGNFISCNSLISLNVPDSVDYMGGSFAGSKILDVMKYNTDGDGLAVLGGWVFGISDSVERFVLPEGLKGAVSGIFKSPALKHVELPDNYVMSNGEFQPAYNSTTSLESVVLPDTLAFLPDNAFRSCVALEQITIPASVTSVGNYVFSGCTSLKSVEFEGALNGMGLSVFDNTPLRNGLQAEGNVYYWKSYAIGFNALNMSDVVLKDGTRGIAGGAFDGCAMMTSVEFPETVVFIGAQAFNGCAGLTYVDLSKTGITSVSDSAFKGCSLLAGVSLPDAVNTIGMNAFQNCALTAFVAPSGLKTVLSTAFGNNSALASVTLNEGLEVIGANAFQYCPQIKTISIPSTVTKIDINVFWGHGLESVYFLGDTPCEMGTNIFTAYGQGTIPALYVPQGRADAYKSAVSWASYADYVQEAPSS